MKKVVPRLVTPWHSCSHASRFDSGAGAKQLTINNSVTAVKTWETGGQSGIGE